MIVEVKKEVMFCNACNCEIKTPSSFVKFTLEKASFTYTANDKIAVYGKGDPRDIFDLCNGCANTFLQGLVNK